MKSSNKSKMQGLPSHGKSGQYKQSGGYQAILTIPTERQKSSELTQSKEVLSIKTMSYCSRYDSCDAPKCPLDILIEMRSYVDGDPQCGMAKSTRHRYWEKMPEDLRKELPYRGYFQGEFTRMTAAREKWNSMSEEKRQEIIERLKKNRTNGHKGDGPQ